MRRALLVLSILAVGILMIGSYFWIHNAVQGAATAPAPRPASKPVPASAREVPSANNQTLPTAPKTAHSSSATRQSVASRPAHPPLSKLQLDRLMDRHDCINVPRTPARLASDLEYFDFASENWSDAMLAAYKFDLAYAPGSKTANASANITLAISALMQRCANYDKLQAENSEGAPDHAKLDWSEYPEWAAKVDVYEPKQVEKLIAAGQIKFLIQRARQHLNSFTAVPGAQGNLAYRDFRALQLLRVPLAKRDQAGLQLLQHLLRAEVVSRSEQQAIELARQIQAAR